MNKVDNFCFLNKKRIHYFDKLSIEKGLRICYPIGEEKKGRYNPMRN